MASASEELSNCLALYVPPPQEDVDRSQRLVDDANLKEAIRKATNATDSEITLNRVYAAVEELFSWPAGFIKSNDALKKRTKHLTNQILEEDEEEKKGAQKQKKRKADETARKSRPSKKTKNGDEGESDETARKSRPSKKTKNGDEGESDETARKTKNGDEGESDETAKKTKNGDEGEYGGTAEERKKRAKTGRAHSDEKCKPKPKAKRRVAGDERDALRRIVTDMCIGPAIYKNLPRDDPIAYAEELKKRLAQKCTMSGLTGGEERLPTTAELKAFNKKRKIEKEMEGLATSNILQTQSSGRPRRKAAEESLRRRPPVDDGRDINPEDAAQLSEADTSPQVHSPDEDSDVSNYDDDDDDDDDDDADDDE